MPELQQPLDDLGTPPPRDAAAQISLQIDGQQVRVDEGTSVMRAAAMLGTSIPSLCATGSLDAFGSCRMCLVEIEGRKGTPASCTTLAALDFHQAHTTGAKGIQVIGGAEFGNVAAQHGCGTYDRSPFGYLYMLSVDLQADLCGRVPWWRRTQII